MIMSSVPSTFLMISMISISSLVCSVRGFYWYKSVAESVMKIGMLAVIVVQPLSSCILRFFDLASFIV